MAQVMPAVRGQSVRCGLGCAPQGPGAHHRVSESTKACRYSWQDRRILSNRMTRAANRAFPTQGWRSLKLHLKMPDHPIAVRLYHGKPRTPGGICERAKGPYPYSPGKKIII